MNPETGGFVNSAVNRKYFKADVCVCAGASSPFEIEIEIEYTAHMYIGCISDDVNSLKILVYSRFTYRLYISWVTWANEYSWHVKLNTKILKIFNTADLHIVSMFYLYFNLYLKHTNHTCATDSSISGTHLSHLFGFNTQQSGPFMSVFTVKAGKSHEEKEIWILAGDRNPWVAATLRTMGTTLPADLPIAWLL